MSCFSSSKNILLDIFKHIRLLKRQQFRECYTTNRAINTGNNSSIFFDIIDNIGMCFYCRNNWICLFANHIDPYLVSQFSLRYLKKVDQIYNQPRRSNFQANFSINWSARHFFGWIIPMIFTENSDILWNCGLDAYFFLRYIYILLKIFVPLTLLIPPVLIPLNFLRGETNSTEVRGLDRFSWANLNTTYVKVY